MADSQVDRFLRHPAGTALPGGDLPECLRQRQQVGPTQPTCHRTSRPPGRTGSRLAFHALGKAGGDLCQWHSRHTPCLLLRWGPAPLAFCASAPLRLKMLQMEGLGHGASTIFPGAGRPRKRHSAPPTWVTRLLSAQVLARGSRNPGEFLRDMHARSISGSDEGALGSSWVGAGPHKAQATTRSLGVPALPYLQRRAGNGASTHSALWRSLHKVPRVQVNG